ncbi:uncharacterized protein LOC135469158 isoform X2 [Liolophura sinensis]|uniref:uncharacterized protein LOC135469158 isoform X2 n=1 Tax=Liolophura sinensis TaxID=3198878 RepID=UPI0031584BE5
MSLDQLLSLGVASGVVLMSHLGTVSYSYGDLTNVSQEELKQFVSQFDQHPKPEENFPAEPGYVLSIGGQETRFKIFKKTYCSIYCTTKGHNSGLVIGNLPHGILLCTYHRPVHSVQATQTIEAFCNKLRA